ncbi:MAG TPA: AMP-binding protein [Kofleriaceae bacterium]|nr:AMP-binding protein [Kofleriaceae bacterium]
MHPAIRRAAASTVASLFEAAARTRPARLAIVDATRTVTYGELAERVRRLANVLASEGLARGDRVAVTTENRGEALELLLAAARLGAIVACQNWRLAPIERARCIALVEPKLRIASPRFAGEGAAIVLGGDHERRLAAASPAHDAPDVDPEDPLVILYTSGTTGLPKGATISHRAQIVRNLVTRAEFGVAQDDTFVAWSPLYHMGAVDNSLGTLMAGGTVIVVDGFDPARLAELVAREPLGWLLLMPGMVGRFADELEQRAIRPRGVKLCGVMADLVPPADIARITRLLGAPYANTFGATETGCPPCSSSLIPIGVAPVSLAKQQSPFCEIRLVDADDRDVADGAPGELAMRGPTLFSGYWANPDANAHDFRGGWFHMGDVFVRAPDGSLAFVDRVKYLIKTGGENVYPAEIERVMLQDARVIECAVVRAPDARWGEVPVAFVARRDDTLDDAALYARCRAELAGYKQPKQIHFIAESEFPRSASGKVLRHELEGRAKAAR